jgi:FMN phosphatase YigB (HAD superfamily)
MIRAIIFDIGNVLLKFDYQIAYRRLLPDCTVLGDDVYPSADVIKQAYERGEIARADFLVRVREVLRHGGSEANFVTAWEEIFEVNDPMIELARRLREKYPLYLLSNISDLHTDYIFRTYPFFAWFQDAVYSYRAGALKPEPDIYTQAIRQFGVRAEETVFIDDLPANVAAATAAGLHAIQYDYRKHEALWPALAKLGVELPDERQTT